jgi:hypothetical protein
MNVKNHSSVLCSALPAIALLTGLTLVLGLGTAPAAACTIFVLTDANRALFCNNEDWSNSVTRLWFVPAGDGRLGCAYVGFDNGWAQGGVNTAGLAFDWVAGFKEKWEPGPEMHRLQGNSSERLLETGTTVEDVIAFYRTHWEPGFSYAKILVADRTGASVIIGAHDGQLQVEQSRESRGFGYGRRILATALAKGPEPTVDNGLAILRDCRQSGPYATKYANVFDLKSGDLVLLPTPDLGERVTLNLAAELAKGAHYYDLPNIRAQLAEPPRPLLDNMKRSARDESARKVVAIPPEIARLKSDPASPSSRP